MYRFTTDSPAVRSELSHLARQVMNYMIDTFACVGVNGITWSNGDGQAQIKDGKIYVLFRDRDRKPMLVIVLDEQEERWARDVESALDAQ